MNECMWFSVWNGSAWSTRYWHAPTVDDLQKYLSPECQLLGPFETPIDAIGAVQLKLIQSKKEKEQ